VRFAATPLAECGHVMYSGAEGILLRDVSSGSVDLPARVLGTDGRPIALRLSSTCSTGVVVVNRSPGILRVGGVVTGNMSGVVAALVYGVGPGTGELMVLQPSGRQSLIRIPVTTGCC
jgi:hypothetical protein